MLALCLCSFLPLMQPAPSPDPIDDLLALLPRNTAGFVLVPNLDRASDDLKATLKGMDRAGLLFGGDPLDQLLSALGTPLQIDHAGAAIIAWVLPERSADGSQTADPATSDAGEAADQPPPEEEHVLQNPIIVAYVPSPDPQQFLELNFEPTESEGVFLHESGTALYGRALSSHAALSLDPLQDVLQPLGHEGLAAFRQRWSEQAIDLLASGDIVLAGNARAVEGAFRELMTRFGKTQTARALFDQAAAQQGGPCSRLLQAITASSAGGVTAIDFDPLAIVFRTTVQLRDVQQIDHSGRQRTGLASLPLDSYHLAMSTNLMPLHRLAALRNSLPFLATENDRWIELVHAVNFAAYESPAGLRGGLFNGAALLLSTDRPDELRDLIRRDVKAVQAIEDGVERRVAWREDRPIEGVGAADVFEIRLMRVPEKQMYRQVIQRLVFGPAGINGYVHRFDRGVIVTFSQRPDVLRRVVASMKDGQSLADDPIITAMRQWMAGDPDVEWYVDVGSLMELLRNAVEFYPMLPDLPRHERQDDLPPIGFSASVHDARIDSTAIVPSAVAAVLFDQLMRVIPAGGVENTP